MVYNSRSQEEDSGREQKREQARVERLAEQSLKFAKKIAETLESKAEKGTAVITQCHTANTDIKKVTLELHPVSLTVKHRGYIVSIPCDNPSALSAKFRQWCRANMSHVTKIEPRAN
jgi:hypothetical protein